MKIIDFFEKSLNGLTIDCMYLARHGDLGTTLYAVPWHKDDYATMEITLNDKYDGGHVHHLNEAGVHKTEARPGSVTGKQKMRVIYGWRISVFANLLTFIRIMQRSPHG